MSIVNRFIGQEGRISPKRNSIPAPVATERPAGKRLAGIPFPLSIVQKAARSKVPLEPFHQLIGKDSLGWPQRRGVPFTPCHVVGGDKGGFSTHRQAHVASYEISIDLATKRFNLQPLLLGVR